MSTTLVARPAPGSPDPVGATPARPGAVAVKRGPLRRVADLRHHSPGRLQLIIAILLALGLLTGLVAGLAAHSAGAGTTDLGNRAQPLLIEAETIYSALADADTTAAQAFLAGGLEPPALTVRYDNDLTRATTALSSAARRTPENSKAATAVSGLSAGVSQYAALVATARADNRKGLPVGASYLSAASQLNRDTLLKQADELFRIAQAEVRDGYRSAAAVGWVAVLVLLLIALLVALVAVQRYLSRSTRRTFNLPLVAATLLTLLLGLGAGGVFLSQNVHLSRADDQGSAPAADLAGARILALRERGDEALTLAAHGSGGLYESDFAEASRQLSAGPLGNDYLPPAAVAAHQSYLAAHQQVRKLDDGGDWDAAVQLAIGVPTTTTFEAVTTDIGTALEQRKVVFTTQIDDAGHGLGLLTVLGPLLALIVCGLAWAGIRARLEEYR